MGPFPAMPGTAPAVVHPFGIASRHYGRSLPSVGLSLRRPGASQCYLTLISHFT